MFPVKRIHRERAAAGQVQMSDAGSKALVEVPIGNMPHGHLLLHNAAAWSIRCTFTSLYIIQTPKHPSSLFPLVNELKKSISLVGPVTMWDTAASRKSNLSVYPAKP